MINKNEFYDKNDYPETAAKRKMWYTVNNSIEKSNSNRSSFIDLRSFAYGVSFTILIFALSLAAIKLVPQILNPVNSEEVKINKAYSSAADELEKSLPNFVSTLDKSERTRQLLNVRMEELQYINNAIKQFKYSINHSDISALKQQRLLELYQMKIDAINKIIQLRGGSWL